MNPSTVISNAQTKISAAVAHLQDELAKLRTGRAHPTMLDGLMVSAYGTSMPLIQVGTVTAPEAQLLQISPFDPGNIQAIASAIRDNPSLGLNPSDDGRVVRVPIPALTEERRRDIVKQLGTKVEEYNIAVRNIRHDSLDEIDKAKKDKLIGEDDAKRLSSQIEDVVAKHKQEVDAIAKTKEQEIMKV
jgi:ribosome recycling factor